MHNQFGSDEHGKGHEKSDMHFKVMKEGKPAGVPTDGAKGCKH
jgi:hypothetical protein